MEGEREREKEREKIKRERDRERERDLRLVVQLLDFITLQLQSHGLVYAEKRRARLCIFAPPHEHSHAF
jgi:hypothetical protein